MALMSTTHLTSLPSPTVLTFLILLSRLDHPGTEHLYVSERVLNVEYVGDIRNVSNGV